MIHGYIVIKKKSGGKGPEYPVKSSVKIGRGTKCDIRIHVQSVSEQHCLIFVEKGRKALIQNLSSNASTFVNGVSIGGGICALNHGDTVSVGERSFTWRYSPYTPFYEGKKNSQSKRRKSDADSYIGSQNVAVVNPMYHKRRTLGPNTVFSEMETRISKGPVSKTQSLNMDSGSTDQNSLIGSPTPFKTPSVSFTPGKSSRPRKSSILLKTPDAKSPASQRLSNRHTPAALRTSGAKSSGRRTPARVSSSKKSSIEKTPAHEDQPYAIEDVSDISPSQKSPSFKSATPKEPVLRSGGHNTPCSQSIAPETSFKSSNKKTQNAKSPSTQTFAQKAGLATSPVSKRTQSDKTPQSTQSSSTRKSKASVKKSPKGKKRRLSSPAVASKRLKIESPKSIDKKKMAVLMEIHGKSSPRVMSSKLSSVKVVLSGKRTPLIKAIKTPKASTSKQLGAVTSSIKKPRRPLFSEVLKKKAVQKANSVAKKLTLAAKHSSKAPLKKSSEAVMSLDIPAKFKFGSTGHANSPETIFIGRKIAKTPIVTKKGRKQPLLVNHVLKSNLDLSGISELFKTPGKVPAELNDGEHASIGKRKGSRSSAASLKSPSPASLEQLSRKQSISPETLKSPSTSPRESHKMFAPKTPLEVKSPKSLKSPIQSRSGSSAKRSLCSTPSNIGSTEKSSRKSSTASAQSKSLRASTRTPQSLSKSVQKAVPVSGVKSIEKQHLLHMTSTPAALGKRHSFSETFESPSAASREHTPQSPASGRRSRFAMASSKIPYVHSPHASPGKSSLKSSPPKSPEKNLSVSFNDSINIKLLLPGLRRSVNTTAPLSSPLSQEPSGPSTPDVTTFDFNSVKTPNVPNEMFVSSILSSGASSSCSQNLGSAKRKGRTLKSPHNDLTDVQGVRRLFQTTASPPGYMDVKGVKQLMATQCKTPSYLAVEGVKKLFGDATAAAGNDLSSFPGVRELFASPSPSKSKLRYSLQQSPSKVSPRKSSPVAKIQAEVESKGRAIGMDLEVNEKAASCSVSPVSSSPRRDLLSSMSPKSQNRAQSGKPITEDARKTRNKRNITLSPDSNDQHPQLSLPAEKSTLKRSRRGAQKNEQVDKSLEMPSVEVAVSGRRLRKATKEAHVLTTPAKSPETGSPPKRKTRGAVKISSPMEKSPTGNVAKTRTRRGAKVTSPVVEEEARNPHKVSKTTTRQRVKASSIKSEEKEMSPASPTRSQLSKSNDVKSPPAKRATRRTAKTSSLAEDSKISKRPLALNEESVASPAKKSKMDEVESTFSDDILPKRTSRRNIKKESSAKKEESPLCAPSSKKRKAVTFEDIDTPSKKIKESSLKGDAIPSPGNVSSPVRKTRNKKATSKEDVQVTTEPSSKRRPKAPKKESSPPRVVSPRRTRSRK